MRILEDDGAGLGSVDDLCDYHEQDHRSKNKDPGFEEEPLTKDIELNTNNHLPQNHHQVSNHLMRLLDREQRGTERVLDHLGPRNIPQHKLHQHQEHQHKRQRHLNHLGHRSGLGLRLCVERDGVSEDVHRGEQAEDHHADRVDVDHLGVGLAVAD